MLKILQPAELCGLHLKNRLFRSATWLALCRPDGTPTPELYQHYRQLAQGGIGTIITELTDVCERNNAIGNNMRLYTDALIPAYQQLVAIAHASGAAIIPQLNMYQYVRPGTGQQTLDVNALTPEDLAEIRQLYIAAAVRAKQCGFDAVQLHLAYGWLLYRFLNPYYNQRQDAYGGTPENRCRLIVEIIQGIKAQLPDYPICAKFSFYFKPQAEIRRILAQHKDQPLPIAPAMQPTNAPASASTSMLAAWTLSKSWETMPPGKTAIATPPATRTWPKPSEPNAPSPSSSPAATMSPSSWNNSWTRTK